MGGPKVGNALGSGGIVLTVPSGKSRGATMPIILEANIRAEMRIRRVAPPYVPPRPTVWSPSHNAWLSEGDRRTTSWDARKN